VPDDVTIKGWILRETPSGMAWIFLWDERERAMDTVVLPKSMVAIVKDVMGDKVTLPKWLAQERGLY
jgi:hypothetical protein